MIHSMNEWGRLNAAGSCAWHSLTLLGNLFEALVLTLSNE